MSTTISRDVNEMSEASFSDGWTRVTGYRPAAVLTDRREMIAMLMEEVAILPEFPQHSSTFHRANARRLRPAADARLEPQRAVRSLGD